MRLQKRWVLIGQQKLRFNYMNEIIQKVKNLSIGFRSKKGEEILILRNISTNIQKGETVGIVGESGSGKSTLALAMMHDAERVKLGLVEESPQYFTGNSDIESSLQL